MPRLLPSRSTIQNVLARTGGMTLLERIPAWRGLVALNYHRIGSPNGSLLDWEMWSATAEDFERHVLTLKSHYDVIGLADLSAALGDLGRRSSGQAQRFVMITFDDGYRDNFEAALPILQSHGVPGVFFLTTGFLDRGGLAWWDEIAWMVRSSRLNGLSIGLPGLDQPLPFDQPNRQLAIRQLLGLAYRLDGQQRDAFLIQLADVSGSGRAPNEVSQDLWMNWDMARQIRDAGMSLGAHTVSHPVLSRLTADAQNFEVCESRLRLETELRQPVTALSYPVGRRDCFNADTRTALSQNGFDWAFSFYGGYSDGSKVDRFDIPRVGVERDMSPTQVRSVAALPQLFSRH